MLLRENPSFRWTSLAKSCLLVIALGAVGACGRERDSFVDPFGETPTSTSIVSGSRIDLLYADYPVHGQTAGKQRDRAHVIARSVWRKIGATHSVDTVRVTFRDKHLGFTSRKQHDASYLFLRKHLETEARP